MPSSVIRTVAYDRARFELTVSFASGKVYVYSLVPEAVADGIAAAPSEGAYFNANIRDRYPYRQLRADRPAAPASSGLSLREALKASHEG